MASANIACIGQRSACALRVTRLGLDCAPVGGPNNAFVTAAIVTMTATPDVQAGTRFEPQNGCGDIMWAAVDPDILKRYTFTLELGSYDFEGFELLTDATLILGSSGSLWPSKAVGIEMPGTQSVHSNGVALEIWTKTAFGVGPCGAASTNPPYVQHIFPRVLAVPGARTFANAEANAVFDGSAESNPSWKAGPWGDFPGPSGGISGNTPYAQFVTAALPTTGCGFIDVPLGSSEVQTVTVAGATGGTFTLTFNGQTTAPIAFGATAAAVQTAFLALSTVGAGNATVTGSAGGPFTITFTGTKAGINQPPVVANPASLTPAPPTSSVTVATTTEGGW